MINSIGWLVTKPMGLELSALGIRSAWATHQFGVDTKLIFVDQGVTCLTGAPGYHTTMLLELMKQDGEVYCLRENLEEQRFSEERILPGVKVVSADDLPDLLEDLETVNSF